MPKYLLQLHAYTSQKRHKTTKTVLNKCLPVTNNCPSLMYNWRNCIFSLSNNFSLVAMHYHIMLPTNCRKSIALQSLQDGSIYIVPELHGVDPLSLIPLRRNRGEGRGTNRVYCNSLQRLFLTLTSQHSSRNPYISSTFVSRLGYNPQVPNTYRHRIYSRATSRHGPVFIYAKTPLEYHPLAKHHPTTSTSGA